MEIVAAVIDELGLDSDSGIDVEAALKMVSIALLVSLCILILCGLKKNSKTREVFKQKI
jgi:hypothetical protein